MEALREIMHLESNHLHLDIEVPQVFAGKDVEVLIVPIGSEEKILTTSHKKRTFGTFKDVIKMSDDFDVELPDEYWLGK